MKTLLAEVMMGTNNAFESHNIIQKTIQKIDNVQFPQTQGFTPVKPLIMQGLVAISLSQDPQNIKESRLIEFLQELTKLTHPDVVPVIPALHEALNEVIAKLAISPTQMN